ALGAPVLSLLRTGALHALLPAEAPDGAWRHGWTPEARLLQLLFYGVDPTDLRLYAAVVGLLGAVALLASALPAARAARVDPSEALRAE
ncbi:MAG: multidrug ABC transporter substrate-binding protein, partial [Gemmatimonadota bacterium]|nr:multidrug ABC transporter substrate-binding protein [Gemmatimonadota bacterium]